VSAAFRLLRREMAIAWGRGGGLLVTGGFFAGATLLLPLASGPEPERLAQIAPGAAWTVLALSALLGLERLFERDFEDGALDLMAHAGLPLEFTCALKCLGHWLATGAPLAFLAPVAAIALGASPALAPLLFACALAGGLAFAVIVLPLFVPPVIFGGGAHDAFTSGLPWRAGFALLCAYAAAAVALGPLAMAAACRNALS